MRNSFGFRFASDWRRRRECQREPCSTERNNMPVYIMHERGDALRRRRTAIKKKI